MNPGNYSRRGFLARSMTALTVGAGLPVWYANEVLVDAQEQKAKTPLSPNDRIVMGAIGTGTNRLRLRTVGVSMASAACKTCAMP